MVRNFVRTPYSSCTALAVSSFSATFLVLSFVFLEEYYSIVVSKKKLAHALGHLGFRGKIKDPIKEMINN